MLFLIGCKKDEQQTTTVNEENIPVEEATEEDSSDKNDIDMLEGIEENETTSNKDYSDLEELLQTLKRETEKDQ